MATVVDAVNLLNDYSSHDFLRDRGEVIGEEEDRTLLLPLLEAQCSNTGHHSTFHPIFIKHWSK